MWLQWRPAQPRRVCSPFLLDQEAEEPEVCLPAPHHPGCLPLSPGPFGAGPGRIARGNMENVTQNLHHQALPLCGKQLLALLWCLAVLGLSTTPHTGAGPGQLAWHCGSQKVSWSFQHHPCCPTSEYPWRPGTTFAKPFLHTRQCPLHSGNNERHIFDLRAQLLQLIISGNRAKQAEKASTGAKRSSLRAQTPGGCDPSACSSCCFTRTLH